MFSRSETTLQIFENFEKIQRDDNENKVLWSTNSSGLIVNNGSSFISTDGTASFTVDSWDVTGENVGTTTITHVHKKNLLETLIEISRAVKSNFPTKRDLRERMFNPIKYFRNVKMSLHSIDVDDFTNKLNSVNAIYENAKATNQVALYEKMEREQERIKREIVMSKGGYNKYIDEADVVKFSKFSKRRIKLDWIKNFVRLIPEPIQDMVKDLEKIQVFDNYVILHYDPEDTGTEDTQKEIERKKDPIIFGVCECSRRLYYIADWIDEYCNLTMDEVLSTIQVDGNARVLDVEHIIND